LKVRELFVGVAVFAALSGVAGFAAQPALAAGPAGVTSAAQAPAAWTPVPAADRAREGSDLAALNGHVYFSSAGYRIDASEEVLSRVPATVLSQLQGYIARTNADVAAGKLTMRADGAAAGADSAISASSVRLAATAARWRGSHGYVESHWYGWKIHVDAYLANKIIGGTWTVAGVSAALGVDAPVAAAIGAAAGVMQLCQDKHNAITFYYIGAFPTGGFACNPFS
jgi:hypothetical protein